MLELVKGRLRRPLRGFAQWRSCSRPSTTVARAISKMPGRWPSASECARQGRTSSNQRRSIEVYAKPCGLTGLPSRSRPEPRIFRAVLGSRGIPNLDATIYEKESRSQWIGRLPAAYRRRADWLGPQIDSTSQALDIAEAWLKEGEQALPDVRRLKTVPGLGEVRAAKLSPGSRSSVATPETLRALPAR